MVASFGAGIGDLRIGDKASETENRDCDEVYILSISLVKKRRPFMIRCSFTCFLCSFVDSPIPARSGVLSLLNDYCFICHWPTSDESIRLG